MFGIVGEGFAFNDYLGRTYLLMHGCHYVGEHATQVLEAAREDAYFLSILVYLHAEAVVLRLDRRLATQASKYLFCAVGAFGEGHAHGIAHLHVYLLKTLHTRLVEGAGDEAEVAGEVISALDGRAQGLVSGLYYGESLHQSGIAHTDAEAANHYTSDMLSLYRVELLKERGQQRYLAFLASEPTALVISIRRE